MINKLDSMFKKRYTKFFEDLNTNVYSAVKDNNQYLVPVVTVGTGGITKLDINGDPQQLNSPAVVSTKMTPVLADVNVYRLVIPVSEAEVMIKNEYYFNHFFDSVLNTALNNFAKQIGDRNTLRWGTTYVSFLEPGQTSVFRETLGTSTDDYYELRLYSDLASTTVVQKL